MISVRQPIRTTILHIRSKDADQISGDLNTNFTVQLVSAIECAQDEEIHAQLISAEIPNSCYNISSAVNNNTIIYDTDQTFTFPAKNYDPKELLRVMNDDATFPFTVARDKYTNKLTFTNNTPDSHDLNWTSSLARKLLGFGEAADETVAAGATTTSPGLLDLATIHSFFIKSDLAAGNVLSTRAGNSTTLQKISVDVNGFGIVYLNQQDYRTVSVLQKPSVSFITFRLTDQNDRLLDLNDVNYEFSLQFMIFKIPGREGARRRGEEAPPPPRAVAEPIYQQPPPQPMVDGNDIAIVEEERTADSTHRIEGKTELEKEAEKTILDHIIDGL
jgi:hypothetical protein